MNFWKKTGILATVALLVLSIGLLATGGIFCAATLHVPRRTGPPPPTAELAQIQSGDDAVLKAWWFPSPSAHACVMVLHGIADSRASSSGFAPFFLAHGYSVLAPDSRAHGESGGAFVTYGLFEKYDVIQWTRWMRSRGCERIYGLGESLGASILIQATGLEPAFRAIVAECAFADLKAIATYRVGRMLRLPQVIAEPIAGTVVNAGLLYAKTMDDLNLADVSPLASIRHSHTRTLLIHGLADHETPPYNSQQLAAARPQGTVLWLVPDAGHTNASSVAPDEFRQRVLQWFAPEEQETNIPGRELSE